MSASPSCRGSLVQSVLAGEMRLGNIGVGSALSQASLTRLCPPVECTHGCTHGMHLTGRLPLARSLLFLTPSLPPSICATASPPRSALACAPPSCPLVTSSPPSPSSPRCAATWHSPTASSSSATWTCPAPSDPCCWRRRCQAVAMMDAVGRG